VGWLRTILRVSWAGFLGPRDGGTGGGKGEWRER